MSFVHTLSITAILLQIAKVTTGDLKVIAESLHLINFLSYDQLFCIYA